MMFVILLIPLIYAVSNIFDKYLLEKRIKNPLTITIIGGLVSLTIGLVIFIFKGFPLLSLKETFWVLAAGLLFIFYLIPYYKAVQLDEISRIAPLFQLTPIAVLILSFLFLQETITVKQFIGFACVVGGSLFIASHKLEGNIFKPRPALLLMAIVGILYGGALVLLRATVKEADLLISLSYLYFGSGLGAIILILTVRGMKRFVFDVKEIRKSLHLVVLNNLLLTCSSVVIGFVLTTIPTAIVNIAEGLSPFFVLILTYFLSLKFPHIVKEDITLKTIQKKLVAILVIFAGLYLVYFK